MLASEFIKVKEGEDKEHYIVRMCVARVELGVSWKELASLINDEAGTNYNKESLRRYYGRRRENGYYDREIKSLDYVKDRLELDKIKVKISDERTQLNAYVRQIAREETLKEIAMDAVKRMSSKKQLTPYNDNKKNGIRKKEAILELSDIHYGAVISNYWNEYSPEIAKKYFVKLRDNIIQKCKDNSVGVLHVVNLGDLINGYIHLRIRLESRIDIVTQTIEISEILSEFLHDLSEYFEIHFYSCLDNHSRLDPNKKDSLDLESMARIIPWYLAERLGGSVEFHDNKYDPEITTFKCNGFNILGVHGDKDKLGTVVEKMSVMTHEHYDLILTAHLHHFSCDEQNETLVISNGSMLGTDTFAKNLRLTSRPSQNLIIVDPKNVAECIYRIILS